MNKRRVDDEEGGGGGGGGRLYPTLSADSVEARGAPIDSVHGTIAYGSDSNYRLKMEKEREKKEERREREREKENTRLYPHEESKIVS